MKRVRGRRSARWLSDETERLGHRVSPTVIAKLDGGHRGSVLNVHELIVIAAALGVPPIELIYPPTVPQVEVLPGVTKANYVAAEQFSGSPFYAIMVEMLEELSRFQRQIGQVLRYEQDRVDAADAGNSMGSPAELAVLAGRAARKTGLRIEALYDKVDRAVWPGEISYDGFKMALDIVDDDDLTFPVEDGGDG